jgi:hypothetical protein
MKNVSKKLKVLYFGLLLLAGGQSMLAYAGGREWNGNSNHIPPMEPGFNRFKFLTADFIDKRYRAIDLDPKLCEVKRLKALKVGLINQEEYEHFQKIIKAPVIEQEENGSWTLVGIRNCGCFHPDMRILVTSLGDRSASQSFEVRAGDIVDRIQEINLVHLTDDSKLNAFQLESSPVVSPVYGPERLPLVVIQAANGSVLKLTTQHPVLTGAGMMKIANKLSAEDTLVDVKGMPVKILSLATESYSGDVVNFRTQYPNSELKKHVIFAEGLAVGDLSWQAGLEDQHEKVFITE